MSESLLETWYFISYISIYVLEIQLLEMKYRDGAS